MWDTIWDTIGNVILFGVAVFLFASAMKLVLGS
jgi:hypothetical protein